MPRTFYDKEWALIKWFTLRDPDRWYADYHERASLRLPIVILEAVKRSGLRLEDVACVQAGYLYPEIAERLAASLGVEVRRHNAHGMLGGAELGFALRELAADPDFQEKTSLADRLCAPSSGDRHQDASNRRLQTVGPAVTPKDEPTRCGSDNERASTAPGFRSSGEVPFTKRVCKRVTRQEIAEEASAS